MEASLSPTVRAGAGAARMAVVAETVHTDAGVKGVCSSGRQDPAVGRRYQSYI